VGDLEGALPSPQIEGRHPESRANRSIYRTLAQSARIELASVYFNRELNFRPYNLTGNGQVASARMRVGAPKGASREGK
jgi:hypothetical protein